MNRFPLMAAGLALVAAAAIAGCKAPPPPASSQAPAAAPSASTPTTAASDDKSAMAADKPAAASAKVHKLASGLQYEDLVVGDGKMADPGLTAVVHYTGWLLDGTKFDSSLDRGQPFPFVLGQHQVIQGWDEGVKGMRVGGKRKLTIPPDLGYGERGAGAVIPPNATLVFEVQLLDVK